MACRKTTHAEVDAGTDQDSPLRLFSPRGDWSGGNSTVRTSEDTLGRGRASVV